MGTEWQDLSAGFSNTVKNVGTRTRILQRIKQRIADAQTYKATDPPQWALDDDLDTFRDILGYLQSFFVAKNAKIAIFIDQYDNGGGEFSNMYDMGLELTQEAAHGTLIEDTLQGRNAAQNQIPNDIFRKLLVRGFTSRRKPAVKRAAAPKHAPSAAKPKRPLPAASKVPKAQPTRTRPSRAKKPKATARKATGATAARRPAAKK